MEKSTQWYDRKDPENPKYSVLKDCYAHVPPRFRGHVPDHRLSMRKNFESGEFELVRYYYKNAVQEVIAHGTLPQMKEHSNKEKARFHP